jgi:hypothetical protein
MTRTIQQNLDTGSLGNIIVSDRQTVYLDTVQAYDKWAEASNFIFQILFFMTFFSSCDEIRMWIECPCVDFDTPEMAIYRSMIQMATFSKPLTRSKCKHFFQSSLS